MRTGGNGGQAMSFPHHTWALYFIAKKYRISSEPLLWTFSCYLLFLILPFKTNKKVGVK
jgi:hypothetical protein